MGRWLIIAAMALAASLGAVGAAQAQGYAYPEFLGGVSDYFAGLTNGNGGIKVGPFQFKPGITFNTTFTDNAQLSNRNKESDFILTMNPTFNFTLAQDTKYKDVIAFGYSGDLGAYTRVTNNSYTNHTVWATVDLRERPTNYMKLREQFTYTDDPYGNYEYVGVGTTTSRIRNELDLMVGRNLPRGYSAEVSYENYLENFLKNVDKQRTSMAHVGSGTLLYELTGKTKLLGEYSFGYRDFYNAPSSTAPDYTVQEFMTGFRWAATARLAGELKGGYGWRSFLNDMDPLGYPYSNNNTFIYETNLSYLLTRKTTLNFEAGREFLLGADNIPGTDVLDESQDAYVRNFFGLFATTQLRRNLTLRAGGEYSIEPYADTPFYQDRTDTYCYLTIGFTHQIRRYLSYGLSYYFNKRDSDFDQSYTANSVTASLRLAY